MESVQATDRAVHNRALLASAGIVVGGALWGLLWVPIRYLGDLGLVGAWPGLVIYAAAALCLLPVVVWRARHIWPILGGLTIVALLTGAAFSLYSSALMLTDVVRTLLLFYLTPVWGTLLGVLVLGERLTRSRVIAVVMALAGLATVLGIGNSVLRPLTFGDFLALAAGVSWAFGSLQLYRMGRVAVTDLVLAFAFGSLVVTGVSMAIAGDALGPFPELGVLRSAALPALLSGLYILPMMWLTIWPATVLTPGRIGLLLMSDAVVGVLSAAAFAGEPFGWREATGSAMIIGAAAVEVMGRRT